MTMEKNVFSFLGRCSKIVGKFEEDNFSQDMYCTCENRDIESPIEQILFMAINTIRKINFIDNAIDNEPENLDGEFYNQGLWIVPQYEIGKYRVDFLVEYLFFPQKTEKGYYQKINKIIVECDSQAFHERTERERRYEKQRDRYLQSNGYKVFRFTGSEIVNETFRVAKEIIAFVTEEKIEDLIDIDNYDPDGDE